jgi:hypothetical protein
MDNNIIIEERLELITESYKETTQKIKAETKMDLKFVFTFGTAINAFYPVVESFITNASNGDLNIDVDIKSTVVNLTICAVAIALGEPKENYKKLFEELRLRGVYKHLEPLTKVIKIVQKIFNIFSNRVGKITVGIIDMFSYTALFVPFALVLRELIESNGITMDNFINALETNTMGNLLSISISLGTITAKHFIIDFVNKLKKSTSKAPNMKDVIKTLSKYTFNQIFTKPKAKKKDGDIIDYSDFEEINENEENIFVELENEFNTLGEYVESIEPIDKLEFDKVVGRYLDSKTDIRLSNAVNLLDKIDQRLLVKELRTLNENIEISTPSEQFISDIENNTLKGFGSFNSFIKVMNALNLELESDADCPDIFYKIYKDNNITEREKLVKVINRFKSLTSLNRIIEKTEGNINMYYGIKFQFNKFFIEYGIANNNVRYIVGEFTLNKTIHNKLSSKNNKMLLPLKEEIDFKVLKKIMKIKADLTTFSPSYSFKKSKATIKNGIITLGYYGTGEWNDGDISEESLSSLKVEFKKWISTQRWRNDILINVKASKFWVYFSIKIND